MLVKSLSFPSNLFPSFSASEIGTNQRWAPSKSSNSLGFSSKLQFLRKSTQNCFGVSLDDAVIIVDHGSRRQESNLMLNEFVEMFRHKTGYQIVEPAHMELAEPSIEDAFQSCVRQGAHHVIISPFFLGPGRHWSKDIPSLSAEAEKQLPGVSYIVTTPLGLHELLVEDLLSIVDLKLVPWGNAKLRDNSTIVCQHGEDECLLDTVEGCVIDTWPQPKEHFPFIHCVEDLAHQGRRKEWESCYGKLGLDSSTVNDCYHSEHGKELHLKRKDETNALQPPHTYVPWVVVDGEPIYDVSVIAPNVPAIYEAHFAVPMAVTVLNTVNHCNASVVIVDQDFFSLAEEALKIWSNKTKTFKPPIFIVVGDENYDAKSLRYTLSKGAIDYENFLQNGDPEYGWKAPEDEWQSITLGYTSGTTLSPKGVVLHHRGAYLMSLSATMVWGMNQGYVYLWTLPMFHCNGWCYTWTVAAVFGTSICLRQVSAKAVYEAINKY